MVVRLFVVALLVRKFNTVGIIYLEFAQLENVLVLLNCISIG